MSALTTVKTVLAPLGWPILGRLPGNVTGLTLVAYVAQVEHAEGLPMECRNWTIGVLVLSPLVDPAQADLALEDAVDDVLDAIDAAQPLRWQTCERIELEENFNAVRIPVQIIMRPPDAAQKESEPS